jgi:Domain of Unknown Function (DUF1080)
MKPNERNRLPESAIEEANLNFYTLPAPMPNMPRILWKPILFLLLAAAMGAGVIVAYKSRSDQNKDRYGTMAGWQSIGGRWSEHQGIFSNATYGRGDMLIAQDSHGSNYSISADIRFDLLFPETHYGDAGLVIRTTNPEQGVDSYQGYYAGIRPDQQTVVLGRASYDWHQLKSVRLAVPISVGDWYHMTVTARGCQLIVTVIPDAGGPKTELLQEDRQCLTSGVAGLRSFYAQASWRNVKVAGAE